MIPTRPISSIRVGKRHRHDLGDIDRFAERIASVGHLLLPIVIKPDGTLIAGERRLEACRRLGWPDVPVNVVDVESIALGEFAENADRKDFLPSEIDAIRRTLEPLEKAAALQRMKAGTPAKISQGSGRVSDKIGAIAGISGRQVEKIAEVVEAAKQEPEKFGHLMEVIDSPHGVSRAHYELRRTRDEERVLNLAPIAGKFNTLVVDPPWYYPEDPSLRGATDYATMKRDKVLALPVVSWAEKNCHLYLWATNRMMPLAFECLAAGFEHKSMLTWAKPHYGLGKWFRGQTEHVVFGVRGKLGTRCTDISTLFEAPLGEHSEKPEKFYEIVRAASYPPYGEAFQRQARPDFVNLYEQIAEAAQ